MGYHYPILLEWDKDEVIDVISFFQSIEKAHEKGIVKEEIMAKYRRFKEIVPSKSEEKQLCRQFDKATGYSCYRTVKVAKESLDGERVKM